MVHLFPVWDVSDLERTSLLLASGPDPLCECVCVWSFPAHPSGAEMSASRRNDKTSVSRGGAQVHVSKLAVLQ